MKAVMQTVTKGGHGERVNIKNFPFDFFTFFGTYFFKVIDTLVQQTL